MSRATAQNCWCSLACLDRIGESSRTSMGSQTVLRVPWHQSNDGSSMPPALGMAIYMAAAWPSMMGAVTPPSPAPSVMMPKSADKPRKSGRVVAQRQAFSATTPAPTTKIVRAFDRT